MTPEMFGAFGDGTVDDTLPINGALKLAAQINGTVHFKSNYVGSELFLRSDLANDDGFTLLGDGPERSSITLAAGANTNLLVDYRWETNTTSQTGNVTIDGLKLNGNK